MIDFKRTHDCGTLTKKYIGKTVRLSGWVHRRRDHGGLIFIDLRDRFGLTQLIFDPTVCSNAHNDAQNLRSEWVITAKGKVRSRGEGLTNPKLHTGEIEIEVLELTILSRAKTPPFSIADETIEVSEELRLKYRFLDIRRGPILNNLIVRSKAMQVTRRFLDSQGFLEISTPILAKTTPEGARDYLVPSRIYPGNFYALPQSPQIFKQILMVSGMDKYFQIAPCFRDENLRADRQPEFTQIDIELSFETQDPLFRTIEELMQMIFKDTIDADVSSPFKRMEYKECIEKYGTDKPDLRFDMPLTRLDDLIERSEFTILKDQLSTGGCVKALTLKGGAKLSRRQIDELVAFVRPFQLQGLAWMKRTDEGFTSNIVKFFSEDLLNELGSKVEAESGDLILIAAEKESIVNQALDHLRRHLARAFNLIQPNDYQFLWVTDFPMFKLDETTNMIESEHHPFTSPHFDDMDKIDSDPLSVRALAYDLVLNGYEIASGSQRIHDGGLQQKIFHILRMSEEDIQEKFSFFINALSYGTPPHLGIALGLDRIIMILSNTENIRDVIAFPKTQKASDLMLQSPSHAANDQLRELDIALEPSQITWV